MSAADPQVLQSALLGEHVEGVLGIASLSMLERALDFVLVTQIPFHAVPCGQSERGRVVLDDDRLNEVLSGVESGQASGPGAYLPLMRGVSRLFGEDFPRLVPRLRSRFDLDGLTPLGFTEAKAYDWLVRGGKRFRPFITLAAYQSICPRRLAENDTLRSGSAAAVLEIPDSVARVAIAIEAFHKASLAHDDIQDDDLFRYGRETLHRSYGQGPAINIGDYLIGLGYQLVNSCRDELGSDVSADILQAMVEAHLRLCDGQGAEMAWQNDPDWSFTPDDALQIYELKTSPAFEAALFAGLRMAGPVDHRAQLIRAFTRHVGVAFQILNDLHDWQGDDFNKLLAGQDALALRPTVLLAWALEAADEAQRSELQAIYAAAHHRQSSHFSRTPGPRTPHEAVCHREVAAVSPQGLSEFTESKSRLTSTAAARVRSDRAGEDDRLLERLRHVFLELGVFERAEITVETARLEAEALAAAADPLPLRQLLQFLIETVLVRDARSEMARLRTNSSKRQSLATPTR
jgi:geranylgeranyl pyrophosphate synthase